MKSAQPPSWSAGCLSSPATSWTRSASSSPSTRHLETFSSRSLTMTMHYSYNQRDERDWKLLQKTEMELFEFNQTQLTKKRFDLDGLNFDTFDCRQLHCWATSTPASIPSSIRYSTQVSFFSQSANIYLTDY